MKRDGGLVRKRDAHDGPVELLASQPLQEAL
jgi:hypothetical protein